MKDVLKEVGRKAFHMLSLVYLAAYYAVGYPEILRPLGFWTGLVVVLETVRFYFPRFNRALLGLFFGLAREAEMKHYSGIFHTTVGVFLLVLGFGGDDRLVTGAVFCVAFGDTCAALVGRLWGRHKIAGGKKSWEGSLACFSACAVSLWALEYGIFAVFLGALVATIIEGLPTTSKFNDNLWMPSGVAAVLRWLG